MNAHSELMGMLLSEAPGHGGRILVVDPDEGVASTVSAILRYDGHSVATASTALQAAPYLHMGPIDLALVDLRVERQGGVDALAYIREFAPAALVIVLTRYASLDSALRALRAGAYDYLVKPVDVEELRITVARGLERRRLEQELAARVGELEVAQAELGAFNARLQQQVDEATGALRRKVQELDAANQQLNAAQEEHDRFVAMVAHEMRGPLNPIINYAQLAKRPTVTRETLNSYTDIIIEHAFRLNRLVDDLQTATRLSTGQFALRLAERDVVATIRRVVADVTATSRDRQLLLQAPDEPILAEVDEDRVTQAVRNLIDNAVKYSAEGGAVETRVWREGDACHVSVRDYGAGIPEEEMKRIFEAFFRSEQRAEVAGSGLGLYITRGIVEAHGGALRVQNASETGRAQGAIFTITLPLHHTASQPASS